MFELFRLGIWGIAWLGAVFDAPTAAGDAIWIAVIGGCVALLTAAITTLGLVLTARINRGNATARKAEDMSKATQTGLLELQKEVEGLREIIRSWHEWADQVIRIVKARQDGEQIVNALPPQPRAPRPHRPRPKIGD